MLNWLRKRMAEKRRRIYRFWDGSRMRRVDPVQTFFALQAHPTFNAAVHCRLCDEGDREATQITCQAVRDVFGVEDFSTRTGGLTLGEQLGLLADFYAYLEEQKKSFESWPTSPSSTEASTSSDSTSGTTPPSSDCGPVGSVPTCDAATPSGSP